MTQVLELRTQLPRRTRSQSIWLVLFALTVSIALTGCVKREKTFARGSTEPAQAAPGANEQQPVAIKSDPIESRSPRININIASAKELEDLPGVGPAMAARIVEHREKYGRFRRPEYLITVRGFSDKRFQALRDLIRVE